MSNTLKLFISIFWFIQIGMNAQPIMENLDRGVVAVKTSEGIYISWRLLGNDEKNIGFNIYRENTGKKTKKLNKEVLIKGTNFLDLYIGDTENIQYFIKPVINGKEARASEKVQVWEEQYSTIPLQLPERYRAGDASVGDLDGDGQYEIVLHVSSWGKDNSHSGMTVPPILQAYELDGTLLWEINLGKNIREGSHYTQFMVYDLDSDGKAEVVCKTADGTLDGIGNYIGNKDSVYVYPQGFEKEVRTRRGELRKRNLSGFILRGPEYLTIFKGETGEAVSTVDYIPKRYPGENNPTNEQMDSVWGDGNGNRMDRFLACVAYLDGKHPSVVMCRGYYTRSVLAAWDFDGKELKHRWTFDSEDDLHKDQKYSGQGNHNLSVGDVDGDGKDEIVYGAMVVDDNGKGLYTTGFGHGDALHFSDLDPDNPGLEVFNIQERFDDAGMNFRAAGSGKVLWKIASVKADEEGGDKGEGPGRGNSFNIDPRYPGHESWCWGAEIDGLYSAKGEKITDKSLTSCNFGIWWDGDLLRELLDKNYIGKWNWENEFIDTLFVANDCWSNNGTKSTPVLSADLFGDWREEVIFRTRDNKSLRIYTSVIPTEHRLFTLMHDPIYRLGIAWQNVAYNQPPHTGFYVGDERDPLVKPNITLKKIK